MNTFVSNKDIYDSVASQFFKQTGKRLPQRKYTLALSIYFNFLKFVTSNRDFHARELPHMGLGHYLIFRPSIHQLHGRYLRTCRRYLKMKNPNIHVVIRTMKLLKTIHGYFQAYFQRGGQYKNVHNYRNKHMQTFFKRFYDTHQWKDNWRNIGYIYNTKFKKIEKIDTYKLEQTAIQFAKNNKHTTQLKKVLYNTTKENKKKFAYDTKRKMRRTPTLTTLSGP